MLFNEGYADRDVFINFIIDNGAIWSISNPIKHPISGEIFYVHSYLSTDGKRRVVMPMPDEDIPKAVAIGWLRELGIK